MGYCQEDDESHEIQQCRRAEGCYLSNLGFHNISAGQKADRLSIDAVLHAKGAPTKYCVHIQEHTFQKADISVLKIFVLVLCIIQIF
jgi:hypothetical protein